MKNKLLLYLLSATILLTACSKGSDDDNNQTEANTWTFTEGSKTYSGSFLFGTASLNTTKGSNNTYYFGMLGVEKNSGYLFNIVLSLLDLNFTVKTYQSGVNSVDDHLNAFYYSQSPTSSDNIYKSSNLDPGPVMNYTITDYDATNDIVTITFSGQAQLANGTYVPITNGKVKVKIER